METSQQRHSHQLQPLNSDDGNYPPIVIERRTFQERIVRIYKNPSFSKYSAAIAFFLTFLVALFVLSFVFYPILNNFNCPNDPAEYQKLKDYCYDVPEDKICSYRYHRLKNQCYLVGQQNPCGENMRFFIYDREVHYGECVCDYNKDKRILIMDPKGQNCYYIFQQGYCTEGQWLELSYENLNETQPSPICGENLCANSTGENLVPFYIKDDNGNVVSYDCVLHKQESSHCPTPKKDFTIEFIEDSLYPTCVHVNESKKVKMNNAGPSPGNFKPNEGPPQPRIYFPKDKIKTPVPIIEHDDD